MAHENLNLLENALDSFDEALKKFEEGSGALCATGLKNT